MVPWTTEPWVRLDSESRPVHTSTRRAPRKYTVVSFKCTCPCWEIPALESGYFGFYPNMATEMVFIENIPRSYPNTSSSSLFFFSIHLYHTRLPQLNHSFTAVQTL